MAILDEYGSFVAKTRWAGASPEAAAIVHLVVTDCVGDMVVGIRSELGQLCAGYTKEFVLDSSGHGPRAATALGLGAPVPMATAAYHNTILVNAMDYEPVGPDGHVGATVVPAALAVAEAVGASGEELLAAVLAGLEVGGRIGAATRRQSWRREGNDMPRVRGMAHCTLGAAAAAAKLLGLSESQTADALGIAAYSIAPPTLRKMMDLETEVPTTKHDHVPLMAQSGVMSAQLAAAGFRGDRTALEGESGFWAFAGAAGCDWAGMTADLGTRWLVTEIKFKRYTTNLTVNPVMALCDALMKEERLSAAAITAVHVEQLRHAHRAVLRTRAVSAPDAWVSVPLNVATCCIGVTPRYTWQDQAVYTRPDIVELAGKVTIGPLADPPGKGGDGYWTGYCPARVTIHAGGRAYTRASTSLLELDGAEVRSKCLENLGAQLPAAAARDLLDQLDAMPAVTNVGHLLTEWRPRLAMAADQA